MLARFGIVAAFAALSFVASAHAETLRNPLQDGETWKELRYDVFGDREIRDAAGVFTFDAPYRAHDAAIVPVAMVQDPDTDLTIEKLTLIVDENPAPVVAEFEFGDAMGALDLETRIRIDLYSNVRAIVEASDGNLYMTGRFVKASGGCSAPALKDMESSIAQAGKMKMKFFSLDDKMATLPKSTMRHEAKVMLRHPNFSGMQMNQVTQLFIPAFFIDEMEVMQGDDLVFRMSAGISISEDPVFRFKYDRNGADTFTIKANDTDDSVFEKTFPINDAGI